MILDDFGAVKPKCESMVGSVYGNIRDCRPDSEPWRPRRLGGADKAPTNGDEASRTPHRRASLDVRRNPARKPVETALPGSMVASTARQARSSNPF